MKRFDIEPVGLGECNGIEKTECANGDYIYASDYDELRERVAWMLECEYMYHGRGFILHGLAIIEIEYSFFSARKAVEELL